MHANGKSLRLEVLDLELCSSPFAVWSVLEGSLLFCLSLI